jgi:hypothetical protein
MGIFDNDVQQPTGGLNLGMTGAPTFGGYGQAGVGLPVAQQSAFAMQNGYAQPGMFGAQGGAGSAFASGMGVPNQPIQPPNETEILVHLLNSGVPVERWLAGSNFQNVISMLMSLMTLSIHNYFKGAKWVEDAEGQLGIDSGSLPTDVQTMSSENVLMDLQKIQGAAQQSVQSSQMQQQQVMTMAQQSMMGGALSAAMHDPGMMSKMGSGVGNIMRGVITGGR